MAILRNIQIARRYNVTPATVGNWITQAKQRKVDLELTTINGKYYITDTDKNHLELSKLKQQGVKFRARQTEAIEIYPDPKIYEVFTDDQLITLYTNIAYYNLIPVKLSYFAQGASFQDEFYKEASKSVKSGAARELQAIKRLIPSLSNYFTNSDKVNLVEIGTGNSGEIVKLITQDLMDQDKFSSYISLCTSKKMLDIRDSDFHQWSEMHAVSHQIDVEERSVRNILFKEKNTQASSNLCLVLQSFLGNVRNVVSVMENLAESISHSDYLLLGLSLVDDTKKDFTFSMNKEQLYKKHGWLVEMLGLTKYVEIEHYSYSHQDASMRSYLTLKQNVELNLVLNQKNYPLRLERDQRITYFVNRRSTLEEFINNCNLAKLGVEQFTVSPDRGYGLFLVKPKVDLVGQLR